MTETEARKAFNTARSSLQAALTQYDTARDALHRLTGEFSGTDQKLSLQFSSALSASAAAASDAPAKADC
ncbi:MAG: hypothetical protein EOO32_02795 [Comamonadaceae bacterium]|nr:MAG: hypothetical protein EOO32_02795 [Comamonadaceae bacterium]